MTPSVKGHRLTDGGIALRDSNEHSDNRWKRTAQNPAILTEALIAIDQTPETPSDSNSDEVSGNDRRPVVSARLQRKINSYDNSAIETPEILPLDTSSHMIQTSSSDHLLQSAASRIKTEGDKTYVIASDDTELREILRRGLEREKEKEKRQPLRRERLRDMVFTRQFSTFDRQNQDTANSPFHGFYVLFWISVAFLIVKMGAENWRMKGNVLGGNEIMRYMFRRDVVVLLMSDGVMCGLTGVTFLIQRLVHGGSLDWDRSGWILQNIWQSSFIASVIGLTLIRDWPWTHTVFFVLHGLVMLMKQHSYAFYNGYLSSVYKQRQNLLLKLKQLENLEPANLPSPTSPRLTALQTGHLARRPSASEYQGRRLSLSKTGSHDLSDLENISHAIEGKELDLQRIQLCERLVKWEIDALNDELRGKATHPSHAYPLNLSLKNHYEYIVLPTVVYELEYPRSDSIDWQYVAEKGIATLGIIFVMIQISQYYIYPWVVRALQMKEMGMPTGQRFRDFPFMLTDLLFPFVMEYLLSWYLIWETVLNILAELTYFADRSFYADWWNSVSWDQFARDWNRPVHNFLLRHVYHSSISSMRVNKHTATLMTFFLSACVHELVMWCIFKKLRGYLLILQMFQLPLVRLSRTKFLRNRKTLGNIMFWVGIFTGPSLLCSLYLIL
ncbi:MBOAT family protein [Xylariaceae sp. FL0016]|nr:MBOAT family protein [Xylariaceae sp. FL0016]